MANDDPTSLRMGFGYHQARASGLGGIRADRSPRQVNRYIEENRATRNATRHLQEAAKDPECEQFIRHRVGEGRSAQEIWNELSLIQTYARMRARGYSREWCRRWLPYSN
jgi:transposase